MNLAHGMFVVKKWVFIVLIDKVWIETMAKGVYKAWLI